MSPSPGLPNSGLGINPDTVKSAPLVHGQWPVACHVLLDRSSKITLACTRAFEASKVKIIYVIKHTLRALWFWKKTTMLFRNHMLTLDIWWDKYNDIIDFGKRSVRIVSWNWLLLCSCMIRWHRWLIFIWVQYCFMWMQYPPWSPTMTPARIFVKVMIKLIPPISSLMSPSYLVSKWLCACIRDVPQFPLWNYVDLAGGRTRGLVCTRHTALLLSYRAERGICHNLRSHLHPFVGSV